MLTLKNKFMFMNIFSLYDFICERNKFIVKNMLNPNINLKEYLGREFDMIQTNLGTIEKIYQTYAAEVVKTKPKQISKTKLIELYKRNIRRDEYSMTAEENLGRLNEARSKKSRGTPSQDPRTPGPSSVSRVSRRINPGIEGQILRARSSHR